MGGCQHVPQIEAPQKYRELVLGFLTKHCMPATDDDERPVSVSNHGGSNDMGFVGFGDEEEMRFAREHDTSVQNRCSFVWKRGSSLACAAGKSQEDPCTG